MERLNEVNDHFKRLWAVEVAPRCPLSVPHFYVYAHIHCIVIIVLLCNDFIAIYWNLPHWIFCGQAAWRRMVHFSVKKTRLSFRHASGKDYWNTL